MAAIAVSVKRDGTPAGGAYIRVLGPSGEFVSERYTGDDGRFTFHVADGAWIVEVKAAGAATFTRTVEVSGNAEASVEAELQPA